MQRIIPSLLLLLGFFATAALAGRPSSARYVKSKQQSSSIYRVSLTDKQGTAGSLSQPLRFLSQRSLDRRSRQGLALDSTDLPVSERYLRTIARRVTILGTSRWQNTVLVRVTDSADVDRLRKLPFVSQCRKVWQSPDSVQTSDRSRLADGFDPRDSVSGEYYGSAAGQITSLHGDELHNRGLTGRGMMIAVIDGGFNNADRIVDFKSISILGYRDFVDPDEPKLFSSTDHGSKVLSIMAVRKPCYFVGTAPDASYWLLRSEDQQTEQEVEEDYWTMAAEFADSVGCDVINSSLGYNEYDYPWMSYRLWQLNGRTAFVSRSAGMLAAKGIILCNSAGNSGMGPWKKIGVPADADGILSVGAVNDMPAHRIAPFSSVGPTQDGRVKPDVVAVGAPTRLVSGRGIITSGMGTSFSSPVVCGLVACLWQGLPGKTATEIMELVRTTSNNVMHPDNVYGYGLPDFWQAYMKGKANE